MSILRERRTKEMESLSENQVDMIHSLRYSYFMEVGKRNLDPTPPTHQEMDGMTSYFNLLIGLVYSKELVCDIKYFN